MVFVGLAMVVDTFNPSTRCREEFQTNLVYRMSSRQAQGYTVRLSLNFFKKRCYSQPEITTTQEPEAEAEKSKLQDWSTEN